MATVDIRNVRKAFGSVKVLHGVSVDIADGEFVVLVGPSGCGKSTLLRMLAGLENITSGEIAIGGRVVNNVPPKDRDIAMVFQNYALYPHMTVAQNMGFSMKLAKAPKEAAEREVRRAARILGLEALLRALPAPALRRAAAARRHGPRHRAQPAGLPVRRAALQPRRQAPRADARRDQGAAPAPEGHHRLRHPRPDRGHDHGRQDRGDERRQRRADRGAARALRPPRQPLRRRLHRLAGHEHAARAGSAATPSAPRTARNGRCRRRTGTRGPRARRSTASARSTSASTPRASAPPCRWWSPPGRRRR